MRRLIGVIGHVPFGGLRAKECSCRLRSVMSSRATRGTPAVARTSRLGDRLRQLRVAAGLTQTDLAGDRFSKEYISQIERGKTRPTRRDGRVARRAARRRRRRSSRAASRATSARAPRRCSPAPRRWSRSATSTPRSTSTRTRSAPSSRPAPSSCRCALLSGEAWARMHNGEVRAGDRPARPGARRSSRGPSSPTSTAPRCSSGSASAAT